MSQFIQTSNCFAVVCVLKISNVSRMLNLTLTDVLRDWDLQLLILCLVSNSVVIYVDMVPYRTLVIYPNLCSRNVMPL